MNADGSGQRNLTQHKAQDNFAAWSPDGKTIAFVSNRGGGHDVYVMEVKYGATRFRPKPAWNGLPRSSASRLLPDGCLVRRSASGRVPASSGRDRRHFRNVTSLRCRR